mgnify:CR=1 FL=1
MEYEIYSDLFWRKETFNRSYNRIEYIARHKDELAECGFYLEEFDSDKVRCFSCKLRLSDWKYRDKPALKHFQMSQNCTFVRQFLTSRFGQSNPVTDKECGTYISFPTDHNELECLICLRKCQNVLFKPCLHMNTCLFCSLKIQTCPVCRAHISDRERINYVGDCFFEKLLHLWL